MREVMVRLRALRDLSGVLHQGIAMASNTEMADWLAECWRNHPDNLSGSAHLSVASYHSQQSAKEQRQIMEELETGQLDIIVHVGKLGEGFDLRRLSARPPRMLVLGPSLASSSFLAHRHPLQAKVEILTTRQGQAERF